MNSQDDTRAALHSLLWQCLLFVLPAPVGGGDFWGCVTADVAFNSSEHILCECTVQPLPRCMMMAGSSTWSPSWWRGGSCWTGSWGRNSSRSGRQALCSSPLPRLWTTCTARGWVSSHSSEITTPFLGLFPCYELLYFITKVNNRNNLSCYPVKAFGLYTLWKSRFCHVLGLLSMVMLVPVALWSFYYITWAKIFGHFKVI